MLSPQPLLGTLRTAVSRLEQGHPVAQAYALHYLAQVLAAAAPYCLTRVTARPQPTVEAVSLTLQFAGGYHLQVTAPTPRAAQLPAPRLILSLFQHERLQYAQTLRPEQIAAHLAGALHPLR